METKTIKNISGVDQIVVGFGLIKADATLDVPVDFHNANFEDVKVESKSEARRKAVMKEDETVKEN